MAAKHSTYFTSEINPKVSRTPSPGIAYVVSDAQFEYDMFIFADTLKHFGIVPKRLFGIPRGGLMIAGYLAYMLKIQEVYGLYPVGSPFNLVEPTSDDLVVDDVVENGKTYQAFRKEYPTVHFATLYAKKNVFVSSMQTKNIVAVHILTTEYLIFPWEIIQGNGKPRKNICHPELPHHCRSLCSKCYTHSMAAYHYKKRMATPESRKKEVDRSYKVHLKKYGLTLEDYNRKLQDQGGVCAICSSSPALRRLDMDHNHTTKQNRGLLCRHCNLVVGAVETTGTDPLKIKEYLQLWENK